MTTMVEAMAPPVVQEIATALRRHFQELAATKVVGRIEAEVVYGIAYGQFKSGRLQEALDMLRVLVSCQPMEGKYWIALGTCLKKTGQLDEAVSAYSIVALLYPHEVEASLKIAECKLLLGQVEEAIEILRFVEEFSRDLPEMRRFGTRAGGLLRLLDRDGHREQDA